MLSKKKKKRAIQIESVLLRKIPGDSIDFSPCGILWYWVVCVFLFSSMWLKPRCDLEVQYSQCDQRAIHMPTNFTIYLTHGLDIFGHISWLDTSRFRAVFKPQPLTIRSTISDVIATRYFDQLVVGFFLWAFLMGADLADSTEKSTDFPRNLRHTQKSTI